LITLQPYFAFSSTLPPHFKIIFQPTIVFENIVQSTILPNTAVRYENQIGPESWFNQLDWEPVTIMVKKSPRLIQYIKSEKIVQTLQFGELVKSG